MTPVAVTDPTRCPLCGVPNACAMEHGRASGQPQPPCWCTQAVFDARLFDRLPDAARGTACICRACAERHAPTPRTIS
ncbi:cysteine-rich CWC family protein [Ottowia testudinis]|uniref:Cysteine-rich CWC family protein n=1 Tax=Ottowia testudinis TaxID=2816950 RepID=A0A975CG61_9BURK|nr:cysteine-rich CWC family protein [Ottowia testudinis]QTD45833.1 cysteine-rich CWC family protein [Ottowia testudinis]